MSRVWQPANEIKAPPKSCCCGRSIRPLVLNAAILVQTSKGRPSVGLSAQTRRWTLCVSWTRSLSWFYTVVLTGRYSRHTVPSIHAVSSMVQMRRSWSLFTLRARSGALCSLEPLRGARCADLTSTFFFFGLVYAPSLKGRYVYAARQTMVTPDIPRFPFTTSRRRCFPQASRSPVLLSPTSRMYGSMSLRLHQLSM